MNTLVLYASQYGFTADCALQLKGQLDGKATLVDLVKESAPDLAGYDTVIIGGSIYMGKVQEQVSAFCMAKQTEMLSRKLGLFLCCGLPKNLEQSLAASFPEALRKSAKAVGCFGGELRTDRMKPMHKLIAKMMQKAGAKDGIEPPRANPQAITEFARAMKAA
ncbi:MAG: flavodoxin domain-containing protein [Eubacteriales bacterium]|nr:flavodoxin domain-containing protein [Eubacteriales bacterium]